MQRKESLTGRIASLLGAKEFISITGGGGKTSLMINLSGKLRQIGKKVLITTTTGIESPEIRDYKEDFFFDSPSVTEYYPEKPCVVLYALGNGKRLSSPDLETLLSLYERYDYLISESDGSAHLPIKIHSPRDPVIHSATTLLIAVFGLWAESSDDVFGEDFEGGIDAEYIRNFIERPDGLLKGSKDRTIVIANGAEKSDWEYLYDMSFPHYANVYAASISEDLIYGCIQEGF